MCVFLMSQMAWTISPDRRSNNKFRCWYTWAECSTAQCCCNASWCPFIYNVFSCAYGCLKSFDLHHITFFIITVLGIGFLCKSNFFSHILHLLLHHAPRWVSSESFLNSRLHLYLFWFWYSNVVGFQLLFFFWFELIKQLICIKTFYWCCFLFLFFVVFVILSIIG